MGNWEIFAAGPQSSKSIQPSREMYVFYNVFRQHMVDGDFWVSKNMKVLKTKEGRDREKSSQGHNFCFVICSQTTIPINVNRLTIYSEYTTGAWILQSSNNNLS